MLTLETKPGTRLLLVEVPDTANNFRIVQYDGINLIWELDGIRSFSDISEAVDYKEKENEWMPYEFIATTDTLTHEQAATLVERISHIIYKCYIQKYTYCSTALGSFRSALDSVGAALDKTYAILKEIP